MAGPGPLGEPSGSVPVGHESGHHGADRFQREVHAPPPRKPWGAVVVLLLLVAIGAGAWLWWKQSKEIESPVVTSVPATPSVARTEPDTPTHYPPPQVASSDTPEAKPLPSLDQSDPVARDALVDLLGSEPVAKLLSTQDLVRHIVVTVDNLPGKSVSARLNPVKPLGGEFKVVGAGDPLTIAPENFARYRPYVKVVEQVDAKRFVNAYGRMYPLFQKAYEDLGYPKSFFNDRLIAVLDHLIATPEPSGPLAVVAPHVQYQFADPDLEAQSAGRKLLIRMGPENAAVVKAKLREIRRELTKTGTR